MKEGRKTFRKKLNPFSFLGLSSSFLSSTLSISLEFYQKNNTIINTERKKNKQTLDDYFFKLLCSDTQRFVISFLVCNE